MSSRGSNSRRRKQPSNTPSSSSNGLTLKSSAYDRDFEQNCIDHGIYMPARVPKPDNWVDLQNALSEPRRSLSPSRFTDDDFNRFCDAELAILDEKDVTTDSLPYILGGKQPENPRAQDVLFGKIDDMAPDVFKKPRPDVYWGAPTQQINRQVRQDLSGQIVPSTKPRYPAAPNFFLEVKGPQGTDEVKIRQACYDGAIGARGMHALQCYGQAEPTYDNMAYAISATYHAGTLKLYSHHPAQPSRPGESPQYHMTPLRGWLLTDTPQTFRQGVGAFRNARDSAREQRDKLIEQANAVAQAQSADSMSFDDSTSQDTITGLGGRLCPSDTSTDGLEVDTDIIVVAVDDPSATPPTKRQKKAEETRQTRSTTRNTRDQQLSQKG